MTLALWHSRRAATSVSPGDPGAVLFLGVTELQQNVEGREAFLQWLTTPKADREWPSEAAFARHHALDRSLLWRWKNDWRFAAKVTERLGANLDIGEIPDVLASLLVSAKDPDSPRQVTAAREILSYVKWNLERSEEVNLDVQALSDEELQSLLVEALDVIDSRQ